VWQGLTSQNTTVINQQTKRSGILRADLALVERGLCTSRAQAQALITQGKVLAKAGIAAAEPVKKASQMIGVHIELQVLEDTDGTFVSRGGKKLLGALQKTQKEVSSLRCIDFGQSTGGFTDCLLQHGANSVVGIDVGKDQLHSKVRMDGRVLAIEGVNLKTANTHELLKHIETERPHFVPFDFAVADLSFISLSKVLGNLAAMLPTGCEGLFLVKPQFELGASHIGKNGLVKNLGDHLETLQQNIQASCKEHGFELIDFFECSLKGGDGNQEFFIYIRRQNTGLAS
jgi:23S rRNA (cytidine1920-2'-O)/16S rRNA (cytidine1409-2'-O)-methyltransferase